MSHNFEDQTYAKQHRGNEAAYKSYFAGMDASVQQKIALTTAHFPTHGRIVDMGSGSGRGTYDLARLYPGLELIGVDINPVSVELAAETYQLPNLTFQAGDISHQLFPENSVDGILNSSVFHHVTSFNGFDLNRIFETLDNQIAQLKPGGVLIIRDFVVPDGPEMVWLDVPVTDGTTDGPIASLSTAALFERFAAGFRSSQNPDGPVPFQHLGTIDDTWVRFELKLRAAAEFVLRKDYRTDWDAELLEEYTYLSQSGFETAFRERGMRIVASFPIFNPWILTNRYQGKFRLFDTAGNPLPFPPTNYLIVGEKLPAGSGVFLTEAQCKLLDHPQFLQFHQYQHVETGKIHELVERPNQTIDLIPWFEANGRLLVVAKKDFPRPITNACADHPNLTGATRSGYITEPLSILAEASENIDFVIETALDERAGISANEIIGISPSFTYYTSPGGINERVFARLVQISPRPVQTPFADLSNYTPFSNSGSVRELDAGQVLRACHVSGMFDARLEINIYWLLLRLNLSVGPWIGAALTPGDQPVTLSGSENALGPLPNAAFQSLTTTEPADFLSIRSSLFSELDAVNSTLKTVEFEYVTPCRYSHNTVVIAPFVKTTAGVFLAVQHRDLPAAQCFTGNSMLVVAPGWRVPFEITTQWELPTFIKANLKREFGVTARMIQELGGPYFPTPGATPEIVYPFAVEVTAQSLEESSLHLVGINEFVSQLESIEDAHLLIVGLRLAHALGVLQAASNLHKSNSVVF
ncbi:MAG: methyltransferase domain-containing protein [Acidobacteria bacterium]|nr:methyltransferase domain-containing protein [Acidobacteriota bacterium]